MLTEEDMVDLVRASKPLGVSPFTMRAWVRQRRLPFYRLGRRIVFSRRELAEYLETCRVEACGANR